MMFEIVLDIWSLNITFNSLFLFIMSLDASNFPSITFIRVGWIFFESINFCYNENSLSIKQSKAHVSKKIWAKNLWFEFIIIIDILNHDIGFNSSIKSIFNSLELSNYKDLIAIRYLFFYLSMIKFMFFVMKLVDIMWFFCTLWFVVL